MSPGAQAGIAVSVLGVAAIVIGCIIIWLRRRRRALRRSLHCEIYPQPDGKFNPASKLASGLNTIAGLFKPPSKERMPSFPVDAGSSTSFVHQMQGGHRNSYTVQLWKNRALNCVDWAYSAISTALQNLVEKLHAVTKRKKPIPDTSTRHSRGFIFAQEFQYLPPPEPPLLPQPRPTRVQKIVTRIYSRRGSSIKATGDSSRAPATNPAALTWSSIGSRNPSRLEYDSPRLPLPCKISDDLGRDLVKMRSVSSGTVALNDTTAITVDALEGHISCENLPSQRQRQRQRSIKSNSSTPSTRSARQAKVPSVKLWTTQIFRVEMDFSPAPLPAPYCDRQLAVREGQMVRLEQIFDDGWALCTLLETETQQGLLPRACLSAWPIKQRRHHTPSSIYSAPYTSPERGPSSSGVVSPTEPQPIRFYRQTSPPSMSKPSERGYLPSNAPKLSISRSLSTVFSL